MCTPNSYMTSDVYYMVFALDRETSLKHITPKIHKITMINQKKTHPLPNKQSEKYIRLNFLATRFSYDYLSYD